MFLFLFFMEKISQSKYTEYPYFPETGIVFSYESHILIFVASVCYYKLLHLPRIKSRKTCLRRFANKILHHPKFNVKTFHQYLNINCCQLIWWNACGVICKGRLVHVRWHFNSFFYICWYTVNYPCICFTLSLQNRVAIIFCFANILLNILPTIILV